MQLNPHDLEILYRLLLAAFFGGIIGLERDIHGRAAGLRTHILLCLGAALFTIISDQMVFSHPSNANLLRADPARIAAQVVSGVGFLGAGAIIKEGMTIRGLTTASCLWLVAAIGVAVGAGFTLMAAETTAIGGVCLLALARLESWYPKTTYRILTLVCAANTDISTLVSIIDHGKAKVLHCVFQEDLEAKTLRLELSLKLRVRGLTDKIGRAIVDDIKKADISLKSIHWHGG